MEKMKVTKRYKDKEKLNGKVDNVDVVHGGDKCKICEELLSSIF
jgi:hypothetical protein